ncbi:MAG: hypothetical protein WEB52_15035 [Dehalococcoidia bacterium]
MPRELRTDAPSAIFAEHEKLFDVRCERIRIERAAAPDERKAGDLAVDPGDVTMRELVAPVVFLDDLVRSAVVHVGAGVLAEVIDVQLEEVAEHAPVLLVRSVDDFDNRAVLQSFTTR